LLGLLLAAASFSPAPPSAGGPQTAAPAPPDVGREERALEAAVLKDDTAAVLDFFRKRTLDDGERRDIQALVRDLGDDSYEIRKKATAGLTARGPRAAAPLRAAARSPDPEVARRAHDCLARVREGRNLRLLALSLDAVTRRPPADAVAVLLAYLPSAEDEAVEDAVRAALAKLALRDGRPDPLLLAALDDADPVRRAAAGEVLCRAAAEHRPKALRLLHDSDAAVRLRVGVALLGAQEKDAVPALIDLLAELPDEDRWPLEQRLGRLAGDDAPATARDGPDAARRCRDAWRGWWDAHRDAVDLARLDEPAGLLSRTLLLQADLLTLDGQLTEVAEDGRTAWHFDGLRYAMTAQVLPGDRVLVAEYRGKCVTERNFAGEVLWEKDAGANVVAAQRLPNGHTFVACRNRLLEWDRDGAEVFSHRRPARDVLTARKTAGGEVVLVTHDGLVRRLDASGKELKTFPAGKPLVLGVGIDLLPGRRVLVPLFAEGRVVEYDPDGRVLWEAAVPSPTCAVRLPDGHTLVGSSTTRTAVELNRRGEVVWQRQCEEALLQVSRR
jgi:hypothetical protein